MNSFYCFHLAFGFIVLEMLGSNRFFEGYLDGILKFGL